MGRFLKIVFVGLAAAGLCLSAGCEKKKDREDTLSRIRREGVLRWGADPSGGAPFAFFDPEDPNAKKVIGFEVDLVEKLAEHLGVRPVMVANDWSALIDNMRSKRSDVVINGIEINESRKQQVGFSRPYYVYEQQLTVRLEDKDRYRSLGDLKGRKIATLNAAEANNVLREAGWTDALIFPMPDSETPYRELELKRVDAVLQESIIAAYYATLERAPKLYNLPKTFSPGRYAAAVRKQDASLLAEIDRALEAMMSSGELAEIYKRWGIWNDQQKTLGMREAPQTQPAR